jgi:hypothetical protein
VRRIVLETRHPDARLEVAVAEDGRALVLSFAAADVCALPARRPLDPAELAELLGRVVAEAHPDGLYERAVLRAATWVGGTSPD